jgi:hypothetical protein
MGNRGFGCGSSACMAMGRHERGFIFRLLLDLWLTAMRSTTKDSLATSVDTKTIPLDGDLGKNGCIQRYLELVLQSCCKELASNYCTKSDSLRDPG